jgi:hypothetical protein
MDRIKVNNLRDMGRGSSFQGGFMKSVKKYNTSFSKKLHKNYKIITKFSEELKRVVSDGKMRRNPLHLNI